MEETALDLERFRRDYGEYVIEVIPEEQAKFGPRFSFDGWFVIPMANSDDTFLVDSGGWGGIAFQLRVDFKTNACYLEPETEGGEWTFVGVLRPKNARPA